MGAILMSLTFLIVFVILFYIYLVWNFGYWRRRGVKEVKSYPFIGSLPSQFTMKRNVIYDIDNFYQQYKRNENFVGIINCRIPQLLVLSPEYMRKVFVDDFKHFHDNELSLLINENNDKLLGNNPFVRTGNVWKECRAEVTPGLTYNRIAAVFPVTMKVCKLLTEHIAKEISLNSKDGIDAKQLSLKFSTEVVADCVLGINTNSFSNEPGPIYENMRNAFNQSYLFLMFASLVNILPQLRKIYVLPFFTKQAIAFFTDLMTQSIKLRKQSPEATTRIDFLNYILQLQEKKHLNLTEVTSHTMTFITDGYEIIAITLSHTLLLLGRNHKTQQKLRDEIGNKEFTFDELIGLEYAEACINETIRLFPALLMGRKLCTEEYEFINKNGKSVKIFPGQVVIVPAFSVHRDPDIYTEPETYQPERFLAENGGVKKYRDMGAFFGFGAGPRVCIGQRFAMIQLKAALVQIVRNFNITVNPKTRTDNCLDDTYFISSLKGGVWLNFEKRI